MRQKLVADFPKAPQFRLDLTGNQRRLSLLLTGLGRHEEAIVLADTFATGAELAAAAVYDAARVYAQASAATHDDALSERSVILLRRAFVQGYTDIAHMLQDADLDPLRRRADYTDLLWDLADTPASGR